MDTALHMQQFIEQLAAAHDVDLALPQAKLWLHHPDEQACLLISNVDGQRIAVAYAHQQAGQLSLEMDMVFLIDANHAWFPIEVSYTDAIWDAYVLVAEMWNEWVIEDAEGELDLALFADFHAAQWQIQDWLEKGARDEITVSC
jgi:hypothetical protein